MSRHCLLKPVCSNADGHNGILPVPELFLLLLLLGNSGHRWQKY